MCVCEGSILFSDVVVVVAAVVVVVVAVEKVT